MRSICLIASVFLVTACSKSDDDTGNGTAEEAFAPTAGQWSWGNTEYSEDTCDMARDFPVEVIDATLWDFELTDDGFQLDNGTWENDPIQCVVTGMDFSCTILTQNSPEEWPEGSERDGVPAATYTTDALVTGTFTDADSATISMTGELSCEGDDCEAHGEAISRPTPCTSTMSGNFERSE